MFFDPLGSVVRRAVVYDAYFKGLDGKMSSDEPFDHFPGEVAVCLGIKSPR